LANQSTNHLLEPREDILGDIKHSAHTWLEQKLYKESSNST